MPEIYVYEPIDHERRDERPTGIDRRGRPKSRKRSKPLSRHNFIHNRTYKYVHGSVPAGTLFPQTYTETGLTDGKFACCQASNPPATLMTFRKPARCSKLAAIMLR